MIIAQAAFFSRQTTLTGLHLTVAKITLTPLSQFCFPTKEFSKMNELYQNMEHLI